MKKVSIILVEPQMGENIGACARAMLNAELTDLRLVNPRDGWPNPKATAMASGAIEVLENAKVFNSTQEAIADLNFILGSTARIRDMEKEIYNPKTASKIIKQKEDSGEKCGILFGCEKSGLNNDDVGICDGIINVPLNPNFSSLNLAQAVLLMSYEYYQANLDKDNNNGLSEVADKKEFNNFFTRLENDLDKANFFANKEQKPHMLRNLRNIFIKARLTHQEIQTLFGVFKNLKK